MTTSSTAVAAPRVIACIAAVQAELAQTGIAKSRNNPQQNYRFRGIDDVYNALAPILAKHGLVILPRMLTRSVVERQTKAGNSVNYVTVEAEFDFLAAEDGSMVTARSFGEAMDTADKATNKAMSAAYKYTTMQTFCIPTEGDNDADGTTHELAPRTPEPRPATPRTSADADGVYVESVRIAKTGTNKDGEWKLIVVRFSDGVEAKTFSVSLAQTAKDFMLAGAPVTYTAEQDDKGTNLVRVAPAATEPPAVAMNTPALPIDLMKSYHVAEVQAAAKKGGPFTVTLREGFTLTCSDQRIFIAAMSAKQSNAAVLVEAKLDGDVLTLTGLEETAG